LSFFRGCVRISPDQIAANIDLAPTVLDACGLDATWLRDGGKRLVDGRSLLPLVAPGHARFAPSNEVHPEVGG
jgi:arylsulfatase A-like enzyme